MLKLQLNAEEQYLLERAQTNGYVTVDQRDPGDVIADVYREWCREQKQPFLEIALGNATSRVTLSLIEADTQFSEETETRLREQLAHYCLSNDGIVVEDDYCFAERVENERLPQLLAWLREVAMQEFPTYL